jgi:hypothetical protein
MVSNEAPEAPTPMPPDAMQLRVDCQVGLQPMPDGNTMVVLGYNIGGYYMGTLLLPPSAARHLGNELSQAADKADSPLITGSDAVQLLERIPRNDHRN